MEGFISRLRLSYSSKRAFKQYKNRLMNRVLESILIVVLTIDTSEILFVNLILFEEVKKFEIILFLLTLT